jgi:hypothetical protein
MIGEMFTTIDVFQNIIGTWTPTNGSAKLVPTTFAPTPATPAGDHSEHAEAHLPGVIGADFTFTAIVRFGAGGDAHLQFRITGDGRYGVSLRQTGFRIYRQLHKSTWIWEPIPPDGDVPMPLAADEPHVVSVTSNGAFFDVTVDGVSRRVYDDFIPAGRLGLYAFRPVGSRSTIEFEEVSATTDPTLFSNFSLLYSTVGYSLTGTKRALLRTVVPLPDGINVANSQFFLCKTDGSVVASGLLACANKTYGIQAWVADFSAFQTQGFYFLRVEFLAGQLAHIIESSAFTIEERVFTRRLLRPLTILSAAARNAADVDLKWNWRQVSGDFIVGDDGALWVWNANDQEGSLLERVSKGYGADLPLPEEAEGYTMTGEVTILEGCDAQLQFGVSPTRRFAVTLQAGTGGACTHGDGPGAIRLHEEGPEVDGGFHIIDARSLPDDCPFRPGLTYSIRIVVQQNFVSVFLNSNFQFSASVSGDLRGRFAIKAWASSVRFDRVAVWRQGVELIWSLGARDQFMDRPSVVGRGPCDGTIPGDPNTVDQPLCGPIFAQRHGFHDCNNIIGESNSHGAFVAGLVEMWVSRRQQLSADEEIALRRGIITGVSYLGYLFNLAGGTGRYKHEELGRGGGIDVDANGNFLTYLTISGVYGDLSFATRAPEVDWKLAPTALRRAWKGLQWLTARGLEPGYAALFWHGVALGAERDPAFAESVRADLSLPASKSVVDHLQGIAIQAGQQLLFGSPAFATINGWRTASRDTGQMIPRFEGIFFIREALPEKTADWEKPLQDLASALESYLTGNNAFYVIPQSSGGDETQNSSNWDDMTVVPKVGQPIADDRYFYNSTFFCTMALEMALLGKLTGSAGIERLAAGHLLWVLGLNPGVPANKVYPSNSGSPWRAAAFVQNVDAPLARGFENDVPAMKSWLWNEEDSSIHRQVWWFEPIPNGFMSIVNGHVIWEGQWDYYNTGPHGWISGETFLLNDGIFARASIIYEDWVAGVHESWVILGSAFDSAAAIANQDGRLEIVAARWDNTMLHTWETRPGGPFADWHAMDGYVQSPFGILNVDGRMELFGRGTDGALWHRWQIAPNGQFAGWDSLEGSIRNAVASRNADGRIEIFAAFTDGAIHHRWQIAPNQQFDSWHSLEGSGDQPRIGANADGRLELFMVGTDGQVHHRSQIAPNQQFDSWHSLGGNVRQLTVARNQDRRLELFAVSFDQTIAHRWQIAPNQQFDGWNSLGGSFTFIEAVELGDGRIELLAIGTDRAVWRNIQTVPNGPFVGWESLGSSTGSLWAAVEQDGSAVVLARQISGELWFMRQPTIGTWLRRG